jgi:hypothetical protein
VWMRLATQRGRRTAPSTDNPFHFPVRRHTVSERRRRLDPIPKPLATYEDLWLELKSTRFESVCCIRVGLRLGNSDSERNEIASANTMPSHRGVRHLGHLLAERFFGDLLLRVDMSSWAAAGALTAPLVMI